MRQSWLSWFLRGLLILGFLILAARVFELQIIKGGYFRNLAEGNRIRRISIVAPRGKILARGGEVLVGNVEVKKRIVFDPEEGYHKLDDLKGAKEEDVIIEPLRDYKLGSLFAHVSGYLGEVTQEEVGKINPECPEKGPKKAGSLVGRTGLEQVYECELRGIDGEELVEVDSMGRRVRTLGRREPVPGNNLRTNIDFYLQEKVAQAMEGKPGAVVVTDSIGSALALYSSPSFDPNLFVERTKKVQIQKILTDKNLPLFNRAIGGLFAPGSVIKPLIAMAALAEGKIDRNFVYQDPGEITIQSDYGTFTYSNWYFTQYGGLEGEIDLARAITRSTDTFFYKIGELVGIEKLNQWANRFGLGEKTGIDLVGEIEGLVPGPAWKERVKGEPWFLGNTYHLSIGQGDIALTPLSVNRAIAAIAANGKLCSPKIVGESECQDLGLEKQDLDYVKEGMIGACLSGGTGFPFFDFDLSVACKTGTAETNEEGKTHAWFTIFGPADFSEIIVTVLVEKGGEGSGVAAPIAREIFDYYFNK